MCFLSSLKTNSRHVSRVLPLLAVAYFAVAVALASGAAEAAATSLRLQLPTSRPPIPIQSRPQQQCHNQQPLPNRQSSIVSSSRPSRTRSPVCTARLGIRACISFPVLFHVERVLSLFLDSLFRTMLHSWLHIPSPAEYTHWRRLENTLQDGALSATDLYASAVRTPLHHRTEDRE